MALVGQSENHGAGPVTRVHDPVPCAAPARPGPHRSPSRPHLLLIEDNAGDAELLTLAFEMNHLDARISNVEDGDQGLSILRAMTAIGEPPELVLLDLNLPRLSGFEVLAALAAWPVPLACPVVVWTSSCVACDRERCLAGGATAFFTKPEQINDYLALVEALRPYLR